MAKIDRFNGNLKAFASEQLTNERTLFGQVSIANDLTSQLTPEFLRGWGIVGPSDQPSLQDFNAAMYTNGQLLAYLHQMGVAEYNLDQEYYIGSITQSGGVLYSSLTDGNIGQSPSSSPLAWSVIGPYSLPQATATVLGGLRVATAAEALTGTDNTKAITPAAFNVARMTEAQWGVGRIATSAEALAGTDNAKTMTPAKTKALVGVNINSTRIDVASASTVNLTTSAPDTSNINITGNVSIANFTVAVGRWFAVRFAGSPVLTNSASLVTNTGENIVASPGDTCVIRATAANTIEVMCYTPANAPAWHQYADRERIIEDNSQLPPDAPKFYADWEPMFYV